MTSLAQMPFQFTYSTVPGSCIRSGLVKTATSEVPTPALIVPMTKGVIPHVTYDIQLKLPESKMLGLLYTDLCDLDYDRIMRSQNKTAREFLFPEIIAQQPNSLFLRIRDPSTTNIVGPANGKQTAVQGGTGKVRIDSTSFLSTIFRTQPCIASLPCDEPIVEEPVNDPEAEKKALKRIRKSVMQTIGYGDQIIEMIKNPKLPELLNGALTPSDRLPALFSVLEGGWSIDSREHAVKHVNRLCDLSDAIKGTVVSGLDQVKPENISAVLAPTKVLKSDLVRVVSVLGTPDSIVTCILNGMDLFDTSYPIQLAECGYGLVFPLLTDALYAALQVGVPSYPIPFVINFSLPQFQLQNTPFVTTAKQLFEESAELLQDCTCPACTAPTGASTAYIHHLINTHEMNAVVLSSIHNLHHYQAFFTHLRAKIAENKPDLPTILLAYSQLLQKARTSQEIVMNKLGKEYKNFE
ncbi:putative queuine tRNA-ribosyltransferase accessory subunit 2 [Blattamonas nauphoetae]|uniref:Queuine tRNA-ribosyltransferase accessory subunit 2 n=1 Tax=Blattamonas nauphoetae TaxID=2049346 RepID=A0ABQ9YM66_9EUKA|nr:putative queuine tRNA-ribosyltransferase accessory subunit 2 [Blattamonas nauphoetae]